MTDLTSPAHSGETDDDSFRQTQEKPQDSPWRTLVEFSVPSEPGNERMAAEQVVEAVQVVDKLPAARLERLKTAVAEAVLNAMEHGHQYQSELPVRIRVLASETALTVSVTDQGGGESIPDPETPDLEAKLAGLETPRGWGLFLIKHMVDQMNVSIDASHHTVELVLHLKGDNDASETSQG